MFHLCRNQVVSFYQQNVWKTPVEEWHFASKNQLSGLSVKGTLVENDLIMMNLSPIFNIAISTFTLSHVTLVTKNSQLFSVRLWRRICSRTSDLVANVRKLKDWFRERGFPEDIFNKESKRGLGTPSLGRSKTSERSSLSNSGTGVPLVVSCNYFLSGLGQFIRKSLCFLYQDEEVKQVFTPASFVSFRSVRNFRSHLNFRSHQIYPVEQRLVAEGKCNKSCSQVCKNVIETDPFQSFANKV